ncbi:hypothetical protein ILUMI_02678 [Ignelater luminosus]|uniref:PiggyBac transposable element-derived protein domain-containing protein n=1 Tax=Ignelater luminosus TaxID=2038154 RepID=A0A8K0GL55_IGNLU|nr:hypothetical protein ILUMI_02678 [Ignelater luminosus]
MDLRSTDIALEEALASIKGDDFQDIRFIYAGPPESSILTDEDSGHEKGGLIDNLFGRQLVVSASFEKMDNLKPVTEVDLETSLANDKTILAEKKKKKIKYLHFTNCGDPLILKEDIWIFLAILILSGCNTVSTERNYWDSKGDSQRTD